MSRAFLHLICTQRGLWSKYCLPDEIDEVPMPQTSYKISEARKKFAEILKRANHGEEIVIMRGKEVYARIGPPTESGKRPFGLLRRRGLPDDIFDTDDAEQAAIDAGEWSDDAGIWRGKSMVPESPE